MYTVRFSKKAEKTLKNIDPVMKRRVMEKMKYLIINQCNGPNIKTMQGYVNRYRYRIGDFRVVYEVIEEELVVWILENDWRGNIY